MSRNLGDNIMAALEHPDCVCQIWMWDINSPLDRLVTMMQKPFPELEYLSLWAEWTIPGIPAFPNTFLGGSTPRLQFLYLYRIPFPTLPRLLLSCNDLESLHLVQIPHSGYMSPESMATSISALTRLKSIFIGFDSPTSRPAQRTQRPPLPRHASAVHPTLTHFSFCGVSEYLEDLVALINAPLLNAVSITLFNLSVFHTQQLCQFIGHAPMIMKGKMEFTNTSITIISSIEPYNLSIGYLRLNISSIGIEGDFRVLSMAQICSQLSLFLSRIKRLHIQEPSCLSTTFRVNMDNTQWLQLFRSFSAVQSLYLSHSFRAPVMSTLQSLIEESVTDILPALVDLYIEGHPTTSTELHNIEPFIAARQRSGHPVAVHHWTR
jgi:hypothetical protein